MMNGQDLLRISDREEMRGTAHCVKCGDALSSFQLPKYKRLSAEEEHLQWTCSQCGYQWNTPCKDAGA